MIRRLCAMALASVCACATPLHNIAAQRLHIGDSYLQVRDSIGIPTAVTPLSDVETLLTYDRLGDHCDLWLVGGRLTDFKCSEGSAAIAVAGSMLQGAGSGLAHAQDGTASCSTYDGINYMCMTRGQRFTCTKYGTQVTCRP